MKTVKVQATKVHDSRKQHLVAGKVYEVEAQVSKNLLANGQAVKADPNMKVGEVYKLKDQKKNGDITD